MKNVFDTYKPVGFSTVNSYLFTANPQQLIDYLKDAFYATELSRTQSDDGIIRNCILKIGESAFMIAQGTGEFATMRTALYLYVNDVDAVFENAVKAGGEIVFQPEDMDYGDRQGGVKDVAGNYWWVSKRLEQKDYGKH